jgi:spore coat protein H
MKKWFAFFYLLIAVATAHAATNKPGLALGEFEPNIPILLLESKTNIESDLKVLCTVRIICPKGAACGETNLLAGGAKLHGASSRGLPKKSFAFSLQAPAQLLDMRKHDNWILNAAYIDRSLMRHKLSYDLFRSLSSGEKKRYAVASQFVELYRNGRYNGVYLLMERPDRQLFELRSFNSNEVSHACIYKAVDHGAGFDSPGHGAFEQREPNPAVKEYWGPLDEINKFVSTSTPEAFVHPQTGIASRLDLDNAIDFHLLVLITCNGDGIDKNFFFARNAPESGKPNPRFFFAPWDYDGSFGRNWDGNLFPPAAWLSTHLFERLMQNKAYRDRFVARWNYLRDHEFSAKTIQGMIETNARTLGDAVHRNALRWPTNRGYPDSVTFQEDIAQMKAWVEERIKWLDQEINGNIAKH